VRERDRQRVCGRGEEEREERGGRGERERDRENLELGTHETAEIGFVGQLPL